MVYGQLDSPYASHLFSHTFLVPFFQDQNFSKQSIPLSTRHNFSTLYYHYLSKLTFSDYFCYYSWKEDGTEQIRRISLKSQPKMSDKKKKSNNNFTEVNIPSSSVESQEKRIDESHMPKRLTTLTKDETVVRKFSGTVSFLQFCLCITFLTLV